MKKHGKRRSFRLIQILTNVEGMKIRKLKEELVQKIQILKYYLCANIYVSANEMLFEFKYCKENRAYKVVVVTALKFIN